MSQKVFAVVLILIKLILTPEGRFCVVKSQDGKLVAEGDCESLQENAVIRHLNAKLSERDKVSDLTTSGWKKFSHFSRHYWYKLFTTKKNFEGAASECANMGAILATEGMRISHIREQVVESLVRPGGTRTWIGLREQSGSWFWIDGTSSTKSNTDWAQGEPNNPMERCGDLLPTSNYQVNDEHCVDEQYFLCEEVL